MMAEALNLEDAGRFYLDKLLRDVIPYWFPRSVDQEYGGFLHCYDRGGELVDTDKSVWAQGRMSWMLMTLCQKLGHRSEWLEWAESGLRFLEDYCLSPEGRMYFHVTREGRPIRIRRYAYSECFAAMAFAIHYAITGKKESANRARQLGDIYLKVQFEPGYSPSKYTSERPSIGLGSRIITIHLMQELRKHLGAHPLFTSTINRCLNDIESLFIKDDLQAVLETVTPGGGIIDHFDGRLLNPGHALEGAWFILEEARLRNNDSRLLDLGCRMIDYMFPRGWDKEMGGLFYFVDLYGKPVQEYWHNMKFWWPHDEALIALVLARKLTGEKRYGEWHGLLHKWSFRHFQDEQWGEWYGYLNRDGSVASELKGGQWKSFYHHPRALLYSAAYSGILS